MDKISFFSADYRDGRVHIGGKSYPAAWVFESQRLCERRRKNGKYLYCTSVAEAI